MIWNNYDLKFEYLIWDLRIVQFKWIRSKNENSCSFSIPIYNYYFMKFNLLFDKIPMLIDRIFEKFAILFIFNMGIAWQYCLVNSWSVFIFFLSAFLLFVKSRYNVQISMELLICVFQDDTVIWQSVWTVMWTNVSNSLPSTTCDTN